MDCIGDAKMLEIPEPCDICQGMLHTGSGTSPKERQGAKLGGRGHLSPLTSKMELREGFGPSHVT